MKNIPIKNQELLDVLKECEWFMTPECTNNVYVDNRLTVKDKEYYTGDEYFKKIKDMGDQHSGYPEFVKSHSVAMNNLRFTQGTQTPTMDNIVKKYGEVVDKIAKMFMLRYNALFAVYPPDGFISWHNNANASAYNFIFTYSETGDGYWKHWDTKENKMVTIPDVPGWQCKAGYFGAYKEGEENLVYHAAATNSCWRMTVAFVLDRSEMSQGIQDWIIEDIMTE